MPEDRVCLGQISGRDLVSLTAKTIGSGKGPDDLASAQQESEGGQGATAKFVSPRGFYARSRSQREPTLQRTAQDGGGSA